MNCTYCEQRMSDYLEDALEFGERQAFEFHMGACGPCSELLDGVRNVVAWGRTFPAHPAPPWLAARIVSNTRRIARETWLDTLSAVARWLIEPRTAMAVFTATLMIGWMTDLAGVSPRWSTAVRSPSSVYYAAGDLLNSVYDRGVRAYYNAPLVTQIQSQIERLREIS